jgi:hypothetical protein
MDFYRAMSFSVGFQRFQQVLAQPQLKLLDLIAFTCAVEGRRSSRAVSALSPVGSCLLLLILYYL